jgi:hypothetical protein
MRPQECGRVTELSSLVLFPDSNLPGPLDVERRSSLLRLYC